MLTLLPSGQAARCPSQVADFTLRPENDVPSWMRCECRALTKVQFPLWIHNQTPSSPVDEEEPQPNARGASVQPRQKEKQMYAPVFRQPSVVVRMQCVAMSCNANGEIQQCPHRTRRGYYCRDHSDERLGLEVKTSEVGDELGDAGLGLFTHSGPTEA